jgi:hypothetical protein
MAHHKREERQWSGKMEAGRRESVHSNYRHTMKQRHSILQVTRMHTRYYYNSKYLNKESIYTVARGEAHNSSSRTRDPTDLISGVHIQPLTHRSHTAVVCFQGGPSDSLGSSSSLLVRRVHCGHLLLLLRLSAQETFVAGNDAFHSKACFPPIGSLILHH